MGELSTFSNDWLKADQACARCGADVPFDEIVWIDPDTGDVVIEAEGGGDPYHEECVP